MRIDIRRSQAIPPSARMAVCTMMMRTFVTEDHDKHGVYIALAALSSPSDESLVLVPDHAASAGARNIE